ncbi:MAG TPA: FtsK/SpoIIIE domain-containing protein, partial [Gemmataceae bacterium]|nr:FtsK/SpoIIIE domain-containing protein [Gemmataceae bacterium]
MSSTYLPATETADRNGAAAPAEAGPTRPPEPELIARQRALLRELAVLCSRRVRTVPEIEAGYKKAVHLAENAFEEDYQTAIVRFAGDKERLDAARREATEAADARFEQEQAEAEDELDRTRRRILARDAHEKHDQRQAYKEGTWTVNSLHDAARADTEKHFQDVQQQVTAQMRQLRGLHDEGRALLRRWGLTPPEAEPRLPPPGGKFRKLPHCVQAAERQMEELKALSAPAWARGVKLPTLFVLLGLALVYPAALLGGWVYGPAVAVGAVAVLGTAVTLAVKHLARNQALALYAPLAQALADAEVSEKHIREHYAAKQQEQLQAVRERRQAELRRAQRKYKKQRALGKRKRAAGLRQMRADYDHQRTEAVRRHEEALGRAEEEHRQALAAIRARYETESKEVHERRERLLADIRARYEHERRDLAETWEQGLVRAEAEVAGILAASGLLFHDWDDPYWEDWAPPRALPPVVRFGEYRVGLERIAGRSLAAERSVASLPDFNLPALCPFPEGCSLLLQANDAGRAEAARALQAVMFRLLTAVPPGKVRFTILDPVGLGQNFAAFMHLADYDEQLVASRIWTEGPHIEQRLTDLTAHMENVIQKYLRNQFRTIEEYNAHAGEVAEPFRVLVVANFPANFTAEAARRLVSIAQSGPRCGVHTLITVDTRQPLPQGFALADLEAVSANLYWQTPPSATGEDGAARPPCFVWDDADFGPFPLALDAPPPDDLAMRLLRAVGERARDANRVQVPFEFIAPPPAEWWTGDSRSGLNVPLGRAGATKRQHLKLGQGTSQHVLVAGKTGSGKSTLLHALITNLALYYSPAEVELYLVDFKKGVEFKTYAAHDLPHARVIAIESEREFGLSVLQRLDAELRLRGDRFRAAGAQDLASYRNETGAALPRILLIVDEFQEFFVEDDRVSQEAAQLLDRLVRQGRAFGLHVLLGSQTLGGAYTLARSTIDQMAVRIALQCSEADAHLILSDENSAARLLSRPGEAIYNDANGLVEGNNPFQVVWLPEERREHYLQAVQALYRERQPAAAPPLVFEGNVPADPAKNHLLSGLLQAPSWDAPPRAALAWLGEPMTIKEPTAATFRPQSASNLLLLGQQDDAALALVATGLVSLAAQLPPGGRPDFHVVDGSPVDAPHAGYLNRVAEAL